VLVLPVPFATFTVVAVNVLPFWMVKLPAPDVRKPVLTALTVTFTGLATPTTVGLGLVVLMVARSVLPGAAPVFQLPLTVQSLLIVPSQLMVAAAAGSGVSTAANRAETETVARKSARLERR
jgi:hypothetical protein